MSLELAIQQNTAAINTLIEILSKGNVPAAVQPDQADAPAEKPKRAKKEAKPEAPAGEPASAPKAEDDAAGEQSAPEKPAAFPASTTTAETKQVTYTEASAAVVKVANTKGRAAAVEILAGFGAKTLGEVKASSYAAVIAACEAAL
jgi:outer membrane biosynthesis protein TonB